MSLLRSYVGAAGPTNGPTPGAIAFMSWYLAKYAASGGKNLGIFNPKRIPGSSQWSLHAEGRAVDLGVPGGNPAWAAELAEWMRAYSAELGVQLVIYRRRLWSAAYPDAGWRDYGGSNPHNDHIHGELSWWGARMLTVTLLDTIAAGRLVSGQPRSWTESLIMTLPVLRTGSSGRYVTKAQALCAVWRPGLRADGIFGPQTEGAVRTVQRLTGCVVDGVVGPQTWTALLTR